MPLTLVTPPAVEPLSLAEAKDHSRVDTTTEDALIDALIQAARGHAEDALGRALIEQTWDWTLDCFDAVVLAAVPLPPLRSVTSIKYLDAAGAQQTLDPALYRVSNIGADRRAGAIEPAPGQSWPGLYPVSLPVTIRFSAGYGGAGNMVPAPIRAAMLLVLGDLYRNREAQIIGPIVADNRAVQALLAPYRVWGFGA